MPENLVYKNFGRNLAASCFEERQMISTCWTKWCIDHGLIVAKSYQFLCYKKAQRLAGFLSFVAEKRRRGNFDKFLEVIAETSQFIGISAYGIQLNAKSKFEIILFVDEKKVDQKMISPKFWSHDVAARNYTKKTWQR